MNIIDPAKDIENKLVKVKEDWLALSLMFLLIMVFLHKGIFPLSGPQVLSSQYTDIRNYFFPILSYTFDAFLKGQIPLWNPYIYSGTPFAATLQTAIFYPLNCLYFVLPINSAINWTIFLHLFLSGIFTYYLLKNFNISRFGSTIASIVYTFSASHVLHIYAGHLVLLAAIAWTPLMFLLLDRFIRNSSHRCGLFLSFAIAFQLLAGYPQDLFYSLIALSFYFLFSLSRLHSKGTGWGKIGSKGLLLVAFVVLGLFLSAIQVLPTTEMVRYSTRTGLTYEGVSTFSFPPENLITFLIPDFFGNMLNVPYWGKNYLWEMTGYVGIIPLLLVIIAIFCVRKRTVWFFGFLGIISLILAMGKYTPLLKLLYTYVPGFNLFRGNSKWIFLNAFSIAVVSGFGADAFTKGLDGLKNRRVIIGVIVSTLFIVSALALMLKVFDETWFKEAIKGAVYSGDFYHNPKPFIQAGFEVIATAVFKNSALRTMALLLSGATILLLYIYKKIGRTVFMVFFLALIILDLFSFGMRYMVTFDSRKLYWDSETVNFLKQDRRPFRVIAPEMDVNSAMLSGIQDLAGYDAIMLKRYSEFINLSQGASPDKQNLWVKITKVNKLTDLLNVKYIVLPSGTKLDAPSSKLVFDNGRDAVYQNLKALPRAFVVHNAKVMRGRNAIFKEMISPEFNPIRYTILEEEIDDRYLLSNKLDKKARAVKFIHYSPNRVVLEAGLHRPGLLILGDVYYPGWKAYVDNEETKIYRANYIMRAIALVGGRHLVEFRYKPFSFRMGFAVSLTTLVFLVGFLIWGWRKNNSIGKGCINQ